MRLRKIGDDLISFYERHDSNKICALHNWMGY
jgi:hypothetical protein